MRWNPRIWAPVAWLLAAVNLGAIWFAARGFEWLHAAIHALLAVAFGAWAMRLRARRGALPELRS